MKKLILIFLVVALALFPSVTSAEDNKDGCKSQYSTEQKEKIEEFQEEKANIQEGYSLDFLLAIWNSMNINSLEALVFGNPYCVWFGDDGDLEYGIFPQEHMDSLIKPLYSVFSNVYLFALAAAIMAFAIRKGFEPLGGNKISMQEEIFMYFATTILLASYWFLIGEFLGINWAIVETFRGLLENQGIKINSALILSIQDDMNFSDIIVIFAEWLITLYLNFVYMMRSFMIAILVALGGVAILSLLSSTTRSYFDTWLKDIAGAVFMQAIHAFYLSLVLMTFSTLQGEAAIIYKLILLIMLIPVSTMLMTWMNMSSGTIATSAGLTGINSLAMLSRAGGMAKQGAMARRGGTSPDKLGKTKISAQAAGSTSNNWNKARSLASKSGTVIGGAAGLALGPGGAVLGAKMGQAGAGMLLQGPRNLASGLNSAVSTMKDAKSAGFKNTLNNLQSRRDFFGKLGESTGSMIGAGGVGRSAGHAVSGVSRQRLLNSNELGGYQGLTMNELFKQNPGAEMKWMQTNEGSAFYMKTDTGLAQVSPFGAADPMLKDGEKRLVDYQFNNSPIQPQADYSYEMNRGSVGNLQRTSDAYVHGAGGERYNDTRMDANSISPDSYYSSGMRGAEMRSTSDKIADWVGKAQPQPSTNRHNGII